VVIEGTALKLSIDDLDRELKANGHFRDVLTEYSHALLIASMRTAACNGLHGLQERCARWILMTLDRVDSDRFAVTKDFLAQLMGTNRPTASVMVSTLEKAGILQVEGRWVTLADRDRLEEAACECYDIIRKTYEAVGR
jgi:CRP-like cAMP-binding protein